MGEQAKPTILVVDDTPENIDVLTGLLSTDYDIKVAKNGEIALKIAQKIIPDLILLDIMMPGIDGYEVCRRMKSNETTKEIPVIFITAKTEVEDEVKVFEIGGVDFITKPITPPVVISRIKSVLSLKQKTEELASLSSELSRYLSPQIYKSLFAGERRAQIESQRKKLTVFFSDIIGFTQTTEDLEVEEISGLLNGYLNAMAEIAIKYGGTIDKFVGDAVMVFFGDPLTGGIKEDAVACVSMALEMVNTLSRLQKDWYYKGITTPFKVRIGINTGYCTVGNFGSKSKMDYTIIGSQVNIAKRLEETAFDDHVIISHETWALVKDNFYCIRKNPVSVKGIPRPIQNYQVVGPQEQIQEDDRIIRIGNLVGTCSTADPSDTLRDIQMGRRIEDTFDAIIVVSDDKPVGLLMNYHMNRILNSHSSRAQFFEEPISNVMDSTPLIVDSKITLDEVINQAMARDVTRIYDHIIVTEQEQLRGTVTVPDLLKKIVNVREEKEYNRKRCMDP